MVRAEARARRPWNALACATFVLSLAACGGGSGAAVPPSSGGGSGPESARLLAEFVAADANNQFVRVWDPAHPDVAIQTVRITASNGIVWTSSHLAYADATQYDAHTHALTTLGHAKVFFDNDGKLYSIDLRGGQSHAPVQLSSAADVFTTVRVFPLSADGADAWIEVQGGASHWAVRSTMGATDAPAPVLRIAGALRDLATGAPQYFIASLGGQSGTHTTPTTWEVVDARTFAPLDIAAVATMNGNDTWLGADPVQAGLGYLALGGQLRALRWSAAAVTVDAANLHAFTAPFGLTSVADARALYFNDGAALLAAASGAISAVGTFSSPPNALVDAGAYVAASEIAASIGTQTQSRIETVRKSDGLATLIEADAPDLLLLGATDQSLLLAGTPEAGPAFVLASGDNQLRTTVGGQFVGLVRAAGRALDRDAPPVALLSCVAGPVTGRCAPGALTQQDLSTGATMSLGTLAAASPWVRGDATVGLSGALAGQTFLSAPGGLGRNEVDARDAWQFTPAAAGSLQRVTANLP